MGLIIEKNPWNEVLRTLADMFPQMEERELRRIQHKMEMEVQKAQLENYKAQTKQRSEDAETERQKRESKAAYQKRLMEGPSPFIGADLPGAEFQGPVPPGGRVANPEREPWGERMLLEGAGMGMFDTPGEIQTMASKLMPGAAEAERVAEKTRKDAERRQKLEDEKALIEWRARQEAKFRRPEKPEKPELPPDAKPLLDTYNRVMAQLAEFEEKGLAAKQSYERERTKTREKGEDVPMPSRYGITGIGSYENKASKLRAKAANLRTKLRARGIDIGDDETASPAGGSFESFARDFLARNPGATDQQVISAYEAQK